MTDATLKTRERTNGISRRQFMINASTTMGAFALGFSLPGADGRGSAEAALSEHELSAYVIVRTDGRVILMYGGSELGQGTMSGLCQIIADELKVRWNQVIIKQARFNGSGINYFTAGSGAVRRQYEPLRVVGAAAREMLIAAGAEAMGVTPGECWAEDGVVHCANGSRHYGELAAAAATQPLPDDPPLTNPEDFRLIGKRVSRKDIPLKVDGRARYGIDVRLKNMLYASVVHCPAFGGTLAEVPSTPSGAVAVIGLTAPEDRGATRAGDMNAVAVVTESNTWKAMQAARRLRPNWIIPPESEDLDDAVIAEQAEDAMLNGEGFLAEPAVGDAESALADGATIDATYALPYVPHVCMEVLNCTVGYYGGKRCNIWVPAQSAAWVHAEAMRLTGLPAEAITVNTTFLGGGLGRKIERDYYSQAIQIAVALRRPVKLTWTREDDTRFDQYRPSALINVRARLNATNGIEAWRYRHVSASISRQRGRSMTSADRQATEGSYALPYAFDNSLIEWVEHPSRIPVGYWRSVGYSLNAFAVECAIDELAEAAGIDPMAYRIKLVQHDPRILTLLRKANWWSRWRRNLPPDRAWGMAYAEAFGTHVVQVVEVSGSESALRVHRVTCAVDCGTAINPGSVEMQMQGGIIHGLNAALWGHQSFASGRPQIGNFNRYRMLRVKEAPDIDVHIVNSGEPIGGIGEPGVPPIAPAVANAYYRLTGIRARKLPLFA